MKKRLFIALACLSLTISGCSLVPNGGSQNQQQNQEQQTTVKVTGVQVKNEPTKKQYALNEEIDLSGLVLTVSYEDNTSKDVSYPSNNISLVSKEGGYTSKEGNIGVTVLYRENDSMQFVTFYITVGDSNPGPIVTEKYTISFSANGGTGEMESVQVDKGATYALPECEFTAPSGKEFKAWQLGTVEYNVGDTLTVNRDYIFKALWQKQTVKYTISFDANGGTGIMNPVEVIEGTKYTLPVCEFTAPSGKIFKAWQIGNETSERAVGYQFTVTKAVTIKALWIAKYTVSFDANGGTGTMDAVEVNEGSQYTLPACGFNAPSGKEFKCWSIADVEYSPGTKYTVNSNITIKAIWQNESDKAEWTLMFYVCGADLESGYDEDDGRYHVDKAGFASLDISEILEVNNKPNNVNIIFETGGAGKWASTHGISKDYLERYHVANQGGSSKLVRDSRLDSASMGLKDTFQSFLEWGISSYPAKKYGVFMWNHGGAMDGCCFDELYSNDCLTNSEVKTAVTNARTKYSLGKLEFIAYDACLMAVQDIADFNSGNFNYMLSSQESESGYGYDYDTWLPDLYTKATTITTPALLEEIGQTFLDEEKDLFDNWEEPFDQTQSVYDLSMMADYKSAFEEVAKELKKSYVNSSNWDDFVDDNLYNDNVQKYGYYPYDPYNDYVYDIYDAEDVLDQIASNYPALSTKVTTTKAALDNLVIWENHGDATSGCGLNVFACTKYYNYYYRSQIGFDNWYSLCSVSGNCRNS